MLVRLMKTDGLRVAVQASDVRAVREVSPRVTVVTRARGWSYEVAEPFHEVFKAVNEAWGEALVAEVEERVAAPAKPRPSTARPPT